MNNISNLECTKKSLDSILENILSAQGELFIYLMQDNDSIDYTRFYSESSRVLDLMSQISLRPYGEQINYYELLSLKLKVAIRDEDFLSAAKIKTKKDYFWVSFLNRHPKKYLPN